MKSTATKRVWRSALSQIAKRCDRGPVRPPCGRTPPLRAHLDTSRDPGASQRGALARDRFKAEPDVSRSVSLRRRRSISSWLTKRRCELKRSRCVEVSKNPRGKVETSRSALWTGFGEPVDIARNATDTRRPLHTAVTAPAVPEAHLRASDVRAVVHRPSSLAAARSCRRVAVRPKRALSRTSRRGSPRVRRGPSRREQRWAVLRATR